MSAEWIDVDERMPDDDEDRVHVATDDGHVLIGFREGGRWLDDDGLVMNSALVTHWKPFPRHPKLGPVAIAPEFLAAAPAFIAYLEEAGAMAAEQLRKAQDTIAADPVNHPRHYTSHPSGIECIQITEHMGFNLGNAVKYVWRADLKADAIEDLKKARWYIERELKKRGTE